MSRAGGRAEKSRPNGRGHVAEMAGRGGVRPAAMAVLAVMAVEASIGLRQSCLPYIRCLRSKFSQIRLNIYGFGDSRLWPAV